MPIQFPIALPRLSEAEMREIDYQVMAQAFITHRELGRLCDEEIYHADLAERLATAGLGRVRRELPVTISHHKFSFTYFLDLVVADRAIYELKADSALTPAHDAQLLNYLFLCNATRGKLINFRPSSLVSRFVNTTLDHIERRRFDLHCERWHGDDAFLSLAVELVRDWGTGLETSLYIRAVTHELGGNENVVRQMPMARSGIPLGHQRFHLVSPEAAFAITSLSGGTLAHESHLRQVLQLSPLTHLHWINIAHHEFAAITLSRSK